MKKNHSFLFVATILISAAISCNTIYQTQTVEYKTYRINSTEQQDSTLLNFLQPYSSTVNKTMNDIVGVATANMDKKLPEGTLGNFMVDAFLAMAAVQYKTKVDLAVLNFGGIRLNQLAAGNVTTGKIFELMPFDNVLILQKVKGSVLQDFLNIAAERGGWPVAGMTMQIKNKKAVNILIGGQPINSETIYTMANSDFLANGGDNADMLRSIPQMSNGYLMRDAIFDYIKMLKDQGKNISANIENRVTNAQ